MKKHLFPKHHLKDGSCWYLCGELTKGAKERHYTVYQYCVFCNASAWIYCVEKYMSPEIDYQQGVAVWNLSSMTCKRVPEKQTRTETTKKSSWKTAFIILVSFFVLVAAIWFTSAGWEILNSSSWCIFTCNWNVKELLTWLTGNVFVMVQTEPITFSLFRELIPDQGLFISLTENNPLQSSKQNNAYRNNEKINLF